MRDSQRGALAASFRDRISQSELKKEVRRQTEVGRNYGRFVMSLGSPVTPETPLSRVKEYVEMARQIAGSQLIRCH